MEDWLELAFFQGLAQETLRLLSTGARSVRYGRGEMIYRAKERPEYVCFQLVGKSILYNMTHNGNRKIIFIAGRGELLNDHVLDRHVTSLFCETIEKSEVLKIPSDTFQKAMEQDFSLTRRVIEAQERKIWRLGHQLKNTMGSIYLERKLAAKLWKLSRDFGIRTEQGVEIDIRMSVTFLADLLGAPRETTSRVCGTLAARRLIAMERKRIVILDPDRLSRFYRTGVLED